MTRLLPESPPCASQVLRSGLRHTQPACHAVYRTSQAHRCLRAQALAEWPSFQDTLWQVHKNVAGVCIRPYGLRCISCCSDLI